MVPSAQRSDLVRSFICLFIYIFFTLIHQLIGCFVTKLVENFPLLQLKNSKINNSTVGEELPCGKWTENIEQRNSDYSFGQSLFYRLLEFDYTSLFFLRFVRLCHQQTISRKPINKNAC